jgi:protein-L-isoaspartate(D-aspartate) O-methyltransferase
LPLRAIVIDPNAPPAFRMMLTLRRTGVSDPGVLAAFDQCVRADFLDPSYADLAEENVAAPLPCGQISLQPSVLALMLEALQTEPTHRVLLVGAGSGYSAAVLSILTSEVVALERFHTLRDAAAENLRRVGVSNVVVHLADGLDFASAPEFDRILVTGAIDVPPRGLLSALKPSGLLVAPLMAGSDVRMALIRPAASGACDKTDLFAVGVPPLEPGVARRI